ncbi:glycoside hydrolase family 3 protein [Lophiostoma macrostomum CBS 122681]|uniref:xylan 1,4-beta-xylosidase n=1 Tax=Lophiostoma macrostomum CBS 122681 TaxID=1314788 RepID=A0A6A6TL70_9PLEO|nr:glycoside hydrolase family 3 protein [Lophiostoma macrostomum CBS 122681]
MAILSRFLSAFAAFALISSASGDRYPNCASGPLSNNSVCRMGLDPAQRAAALVAAMTLDEKLVNVVDHSLGAERIGLSKYDWWSEALHGVAYSPGVHFADSGNFSSATSFPNPITISAAFDDELVEAVGLAIGAEARAFANAGRAGLDFWTPNINPFKDPRWGRGLETPGEDPLRVANYVKHLLSGMEWASQDPDTIEKRQIVATCKHYAAYDLERWNGVVRYAFDAIVSMQDLVEYYLPPFKQCARDSNVGSIMCSYNSVNGTPACANDYLMQTVLREHWNWTKHNNYIVSDCNAVHNIYADHKWLKTAAQAAGAAFKAGTDNVCEAGGWTTDVVGAYNQSLVSEAVIDKALLRQYEGLVRADYFAIFSDDIVSFRSYGWDYVNTKSADSLALQTATDGIAMLKNDGTLPLQSLKNHTVAVIGMWANDTKMRMLGNYNGRSPYYRTPLNAAQKLGLKTKYADGPLAETGNSSAAIEAAKASDIILYFGGIDTSIESEDRDRTTITWPSAQLSLLRDLSALGKPIVVVQLGTQIDNRPLLSNTNIKAILWAGYPGMAGGSAVLDIITGAKAPAGRLPITQYPGNYTDAVPMTDMALRPSTKNPGRTYKWFGSAVQEFGFGLHYTNFSIKFAAPYDALSRKTKRNPPVFQSNLILDACIQPHKENCVFPSLPIVVTNKGNVTSDFVALAFVSTKQGPAPQPIKELASYRRLRDIKPGEQREATLDFTFKSFARVDESGNTVLYDGAYCLSLDVPEQERLCFEILGGTRVLDVWPQPKGTNSTGIE